MILFFILKEIIFCLKSISTWAFDPKISSLKGVHNIENILISLAALFVYGVNFNKIKNTLPKFRGLPHRIEEVLKIKNILFVNDSKSTNLSSTKMALNCYENIIWIAGGIRKDENFDYLIDSLSKIKAGFFIGKSASEFYNSKEVPSYLLLFIKSFCLAVLVFLFYFLIILLCLILIIRNRI